MPDYALLIKLQEYRKYRMQRLTAMREIDYKTKLKNKLMDQIHEQDGEYIIEKVRKTRAIL